MAQSTITFHSDKKSLPGISKSIFRKTILGLLEEYAISKSDITYVFVDDEEILTINQNFLKHNYYTDIITFDLGSTPLEIEAEIYISMDTVKSNAEKYTVDFQTELRRVMYHGVLHLLGFKDKSTKDKKRMRAMEDHCLNLYREAAQK